MRGSWELEQRSSLEPVASSLENEHGGCTELLLRELPECRQPGPRLVLSSGRSLSLWCLGPARRTKTPDMRETERAVPR